MSMLDFLGGAAQTGQGIIQQQMQQEGQLANAKSLAELNNELMIQRDDTVAKLREQRQQDAAQAVTAAANQARTARLLAAANGGDTDPLAQPSAAMQPGQAVSVGDDRSVPLTPQQMEGITSGSITPAQDQPTADMLNTPDIPARKVYTADDIASLTPAQIAKLGIRDDRATRMDDLASAAESMGHLDIAKDYRGQQQLELSRQAQERAAQVAAANLAFQQDREERRADKDQSWREVQDERNRIAQQNAESNARRSEAMFARATASGEGKTPEKQQLIEYLVGNGMDRDEATTTVLGNGYGKYADPAKQVQQLAETLLNTNAIDPALKGKDRLNAAVKMAKDQIDALQMAYHSKKSANSAPPAALPPGSIQIGTSGGKPVWQTPDGKKFIDQ